MSRLSDLARPAEILLVEDNEDDYILTMESFKYEKFAINMHHVVNGEECMMFLYQEGKYADAPRPDIILLDLNMPVMDGREVLTEVSKDQSLKSIPVIVLTTSEADQDVLSMYELHCCSYITKPVDFNKFKEIMHKLSTYWLTVVVLPST